MHAAIVTETWPPEVNGVALTVQSLVLGLRELGHRVSLIRPNQPTHPLLPGDESMLVPSAALPRYPGLRIGFPVGRRLLKRWQADRPDAIYVATAELMHGTWLTADAAAASRIGQSPLVTLLAA